MRSLRIAQIMASGPVHGGLEKHFVELCNGLSAEHDVVALAHPAHARNMSPQVDFQPLNLTFSRRSPLSLFKLHRAIRAFGPDVIHAHANKAAAMVSLLRRFGTARTVGTVHGFKRNNQAFASLDAVIAVSPAIEEHLKLPQTQVICNGIRLAKRLPPDPQFFSREFALSNRRPVVVSVGRLAAVKGYAGLIRAWPGIDANLLIVGEGPQRGDLEDLITKLDLRDRVQLVGYRADALAIMNHSELVVIASEREGFPYVMVEALHLEKTIVATEFPGANSLLPKDYVVPYGEPARLRDAINAALAGADQARNDYAATWQNAKQQFTVESMVEQTNAIYSQLELAAA